MDGEERREGEKSEEELVSDVGNVRVAAEFGDGPSDLGALLTAKTCIPFFFC